MVTRLHWCPHPALTFRDTRYVSKDEGRGLEDSLLEGSFSDYGWEGWSLCKINLLAGPISQPQVRGGIVFFPFSFSLRLESRRKQYSFLNYS